MFAWDEHNEAHVLDAGIHPRDAEDALLDPARIGVPAYNVPGERRRAAIGATSAGRVLVVVFTRRGQRVRIVTARDASEREKRRYRSRGT